MRANTRDRDKITSGRVYENLLPQQTTMYPGNKGSNRQNIFIDTKFVRDGKIALSKDITLGPKEQIILENGQIFGTTPFKTVSTMKGKTAYFIPADKLSEAQLIIQNDTNQRVTIQANTQICQLITHQPTDIIKIEEKRQLGKYFPIYSNHEIHESNGAKILNIAAQTKDTEIFTQQRNKRLETNIDQMSADIIMQHNQNVTQDKEEYKSEIIQLQENDEFCNTVINAWPSKTNAKNEKRYPYVLNNKILYRVHKNKSILVIPNILIKPLLKHLHNKLCHPSNTLLLQHAESNYFHPKMRQIVHTIHSRCFICMTHKPSIKQTEQSGRDRSFEPREARQAWSCDIVSDLPTTQTGKKAMLIMTCIFSRYVSAYFLSNKTQQEVKNAINQHFLCFGIPKMMISDADVAITKPMIDLQKIYLFNFHTTCPHNQRANLTETSYKTLKGLITRAIFDPENKISRNDWDLAAVFAINAINSLPIKGINYSREEILYRSSLKNKLFNLDEKEDENVDEKIKKSINEYMERKGKNRKQPRKLEFNEGQIIYIKFDIPKTSGVSSAFNQQHRGPLKIVQINEKSRYVIARELSTNKYFHVKNERIIPINHAAKMTALFNENWSNFVHNEIKRATKELKHNEIILNRDLSEKIEKIENENSGQDSTTCVKKRQSPRETNEETEEGHVTRSGPITRQRAQRCIN